MCLSTNSIGSGFGIKEKGRFGFSIGQAVMIKDDKTYAGRCGHVREFGNLSIKVEFGEAQSDQNDHWFPPNNLVLLGS